MEDKSALYILKGASPNLEGLPRYQMLPGKVCVAMDRVSESNGILLPVSGRISPDTGTIVASGPVRLVLDERGKDRLEPAPPPAGTRVLVMPYHGMYMDDGSRMIPAGGYSWFESIPAQIIEEEGTYEVIPLHDWLLVVREAEVSSLLMPKTRWLPQGRVKAAGPKASSQVDECVVFEGKEVVTLKFGSIPDSYCLVRLSKVLVNV